MKPILLDTGVIVALLDRSEARHQDAKDAISSVEGPLVTCEAVIAESCYLLRHWKGAADAVLANVSSGTFQIPIALAQSASAVRKIIAKYQDREVDLADACLIHLAGELKTGGILTLDSDFAVYRWGTNKPFHLLLQNRAHY